MGSLAVGMTRPRRLVIVLALNVLLVAGLIAVGVRARSLGVLAEGADYLADAAGLGVALLAIGLGGRPPTPGRPHGYPRAPLFAALVNAGWLLVLCLLVIAGALHRLATGTSPVNGVPVLIASAIAALVMLLGALILRGGAGFDAEDLNVRAVFLDTAADAAAAAGVALSGAVIVATHGLYWLDPLAALVVALVVAYAALALLGRVRRALRAGDPGPVPPSGQ